MDKFYQACDDILSEFINKMSDMKWREKGLFFTEGLAFIAMCKLYDVDTIIESGVRNGSSTEMWLKYFGDDVKLYSVDFMDHKNDVRKALSRLGGYDTRINGGVFRNY